MAGPAPPHAQVTIAVYDIDQRQNAFVTVWFVMLLSICMLSVDEASR